MSARRRRPRPRAQGVGDLVAPGERPELIAALARRPQEAMPASLTARVWARSARRPRPPTAASAPLQRRQPPAPPHAHARSRTRAAGRDCGGRWAASSARSRSTQHLLRPADCGSGQVDLAHLLGREHAVLGQGGEDLDRRPGQTAGGGCLGSAANAPRLRASSAARPPRGALGLAPRRARARAPFSCSARIRSSSVSRCAETCAGSPLGVRREGRRLPRHPALRLRRARPRPGPRRRAKGRDSSPSWVTWATKLVARQPRSSPPGSAARPTLWSGAPRHGS